MQRRKLNDTLVVTYKSITGKIFTETFINVQYVFSIGHYVYVDTQYAQYCFKEKSIISIVRNEITEISI